VEGSTAERASTASLWVLTSEIPSSSRPLLWTARAGLEGHSPRVGSSRLESQRQDVSKLAPSVLDGAALSPDSAVVLLVRPIAVEEQVPQRVMVEGEVPEQIAVQPEVAESEVGLEQPQIPEASDLEPQEGVEDRVP
jgi:hypothetical protein